MKLIEFPEQTVIYAKHQPEYLPLPAYQYKDAKGEIVCCWYLTWRERLTVLMRGIIWHRVLTFNRPLQPVMLIVGKPNMPETVSEDITP
jgi:hypothetical protein